VAHARRRAVAELRASIAADRDVPSLLARAGLPSRERATAMVDEMARTLWS
jgi:hypothetical protein